MSLRDVTMNVEDGSLGNQSSTGETVRWYSIMRLSHGA